MSSILSKAGLSGKNPGPVVHCRKHKYDVYIGRPSEWGNIFEIGKDGTREEVIEKYRQWVVQQPHLMARIKELKGKILGCWCHPKPCHGPKAMTGLISALVQFSECNLNEGNCASFDVANRRIRNTAITALNQLEDGGSSQTETGPSTGQKQIT